MIKVFEPKVSFYDKFYLLKNLHKNYISGTSPVIEEFESILANRFGRKYAICVSNGTIALEVALKSLNLPKNSEVIVPSFTIISCLSAVYRANLKPVFCDVDINSWNMTLSYVEKVVTKNTKALIMVHTYGLPCEAIEIEKFCKKNDIKVIEDSAEAHGINIDERPCGSFGDCSTFSFYANKHVTTGEGGAILTDSKAQYDLLKLMINLDFTEPNRFNHENFYWNYRLSGLQASLGISQIKSLNKTIKHKQFQGKYYDFLLSELVERDKIQIPIQNYKYVENNYWVYGILLRDGSSRSKIREYLYKNNVETRDFFWPLHLQNAFLKKNNSEKKFINSEFLGKNGFYIPTGKHINKNKQKFIVEILKNYFG